MQSDECYSNLSDVLPLWTAWVWSISHVGEVTTKFSVSSHGTLPLTHLSEVISCTHKDSSICDNIRKVMQGRRATRLRDTEFVVKVKTWRGFRHLPAIVTEIRYFIALYAASVQIDHMRRVLSAQFWEINQWDANATTSSFCHKADLALELLAPLFAFKQSLFTAFQHKHTVRSLK